jgi:hypothetical protein
MELFCALLTGFFLWLFQFHWHRTALARAREAGGALLIEIAPAGNVARTTLWQRVSSHSMVFLVFGLAVFWQRASLSMSLPLNMLAVVFAWSFWNSIVPPHRIDAPLEFRERGVIRRKQSYENFPGILTFTPWSDIVACKWYDKLPDHYVHTRHLLLESGGLRPDEVETISNIAGRLVPVCDSEGALIARPESTGETAAARPKKRGGLPFQFNLQSLMLLAVVVSCAAGCWAVHDRALQPQREALAALEAFHPQVSQFGDNVRMIDFRTSKPKPGDSDLVHLKGLRDLDFLNLDGSPITNEGLKHLYPIKTLTTVYLSNTKVTQQGVDDLKRALPNADILWYPSPPPVVTPPTNSP